MRGLVAVTWLALALGCGPSDPSDDPDDWRVGPGPYAVSISEPRFVVHSDGLPERVGYMPSNNNVDIVYHDGLLFMAWRQGEAHYAGPNTKMQIVSSKNDGETWDWEATVALGSDVREPRLLSIKGELYLYFFQGGDSEVTFTPRFMWRIERKDLAEWTEPVEVGRRGEVPWDLKVRGDKAYLTSYRGNHYEGGDSAIEVYFQASKNGRDWTPASVTSSVSYRGGVSEVAFELDENGDGWFVTRNEDGDHTGFGSQVCTAPARDLGRWTCPEKSDPERYDSPEMFRHGEDLYLIARRDVGGPFDLGRDDLPMGMRRTYYALKYWARPKRTALYRIDRSEKRVIFLKDLPSTGDTAFASVRRTGAHTFLVANYTSPLDLGDIAWQEGQSSPRGTRIYLVEIRFEAP